MKRCYAFTLCVFCLSMTAAAHAGWQQTKWGMTESQVIKAVPGVEITITDPPSGGPPVRGVHAPYSASGIKMTALFKFEMGALKTVSLTPESFADCELIKDPLLAKYGRPETDQNDQVRGSSMLTWRWKDAVGENSIEYKFMSIMGSILCSVKYESLDAAENNGF